MSESRESTPTPAVSPQVISSLGAAEALSEDEQRVSTMAAPLAPAPTPPVTAAEDSVDVHSPSPTPTPTPSIKHAILAAVAEADAAAAAHNDPGLLFLP